MILELLRKWLYQETVEPRHSDKLAQDEVVSDGTPTRLAAGQRASMLQENREAFQVARAQLETWRAARFNQGAYLKARREADEIWRSLGISQPQDKKLSKYGIRKTRSPERKNAKYVASIEDGAVLGNYQFIEMIGIGGFGEVYRAKGIQVSREGAIK